MARSSLIFLFLSFLYIVCQARSPFVASSHNSTFIKSLCGATKYPVLCIQSLAAVAPSIQQSPIQLAQTALSVSLDRVESTQAFMSRMEKIKGLKKMEYAAISDCIELMSECVDNLSESVQEMKQIGEGKGPEFSLHISNVMTWVSAALTDQDTCLDGFAGKALEGKIKASIRAHVIKLEQVTNNALSLVSKLASKQ